MSFLFFPLYWVLLCGPNQHNVTRVFRTKSVQKCDHFFVPGNLEAVLQDSGALVSGIGTTYVFLLLSCDAAGVTVSITSSVHRPQRSW